MYHLQKKESTAESVRWGFVRLHSQASGNRGSRTRETMLAECTAVSRTCLKFSSGSGGKK